MRTAKVPSEKHLLPGYLGFRVVLALLMAGLHFSGWGPSLLGSFNGPLFATTMAIYLGVTGLALILYYTPILPEENQANLAIGLDIAFVTIITYASGGLRSGLGLLLIVAIALYSLTVRARSSMLVASIAALAILGEELFAHVNSSFPTTAYTQGGLLGVSYFAIALLAGYLSQRLRETEVLARQRGLDIANLAEVNEFALQRLNSGALVIDEEDRLRLVNDTAWQLLGMPDTDPGAALAGISPELAELLEHWRSGDSDGREVFHTPTSSDPLRAEFVQLGEQNGQGTLIAIENAARITEEAQQLKLASLGQLTASIAHEIRNPLGAISHAAQLLEESRDLPDSERRMLAIIGGNVNRLNQIIESILALSRRTATRAKPVRLVELLEKLARDLQERHELDDEQVLLSADPVGTTVSADSTQLFQALSALAENAVTHFDRAPEDLRITLAAGINLNPRAPYIEIRDNGPGVDPTLGEKIFDPFFTTRNDGTGLGLYIARMLAEANGIRLEHRDSPSGGSCFRLNFPTLARPRIQA